MVHWAKSVIELIGRTPIVELRHFAAEEDAEGRPTGAVAKVLAKLEMYGPGGSSKDRVAFQMVSEAEMQGLLRTGGTIIEPTSGNMGISLAIVAVARGLNCILTMPDTVSLERRFLLQRFGAEVVLTPASQGMRGAINKSMELRTTLPNTWYPQQFYNQANPRAHLGADDRRGGYCGDRSWHWWHADRHC